MRLSLFLTACLLGTALGFAGHHNSGWGGGMVVSRRDDGSEATPIYEMVVATLAQAQEGIVAADLGEAAADVQAVADAYLDAHGGTVAVEDIESVIDEVAATLNGAVAVSGLFDDPLTYEASLLDSALCLWNGLVEKAQDLEAAEQSPNPAIAAISMTAGSIQSIVVNTVGIITYIAEAEDEMEGNREKRWSVNGGLSYGPGGLSGNVGISHSWRRKRSEKKRGDWSGSVNAGYSRGGGLSVGGSVSYSWRR